MGPIGSEKPKGSLGSLARAIREVVGVSVGSRVPQTLVIDVRRGSIIVPFQ